MRCYAERILKVDLSANDWERGYLSKPWAEKYIGARGLAKRYLIDSVSPEVDPLSPENALVLMTGPTAGTLISTASRLSVATKSPATNCLLECSIGGTAGAELKFAGLDGIVIKGKAEKPSYLFIKDNRLEVRDASHLWGKGTHETELRLKKELGEEVSCLVIGPAGENRLPIACINSEFYRQAGRGGVGAVMGSKNLKAIVLRGTGGLRVRDLPKLMEISRDIIKNDVLTARHDWVRSEGTPVLMRMSNEAGILPTRNFTSGRIAGIDGLSSETVQSHKRHRHACFGCALGCGNFIQTDLGFLEGPEYETLALAGSNCGIDQFPALVRFNKDCDDMGMDSISAGEIVAYAMELTERGAHDFGLRFGEVESYLKAPVEMARQTGRRGELGMGVKKLAQKYGCPEAAVEIKGLEVPGYDPRGCWGMALAYATATRGACHLRAWTIGQEAYSNKNPCSIEGKAKMVIDQQHLKAVKYSTGVCDFWSISYPTLARLHSFIFEREVTPEEVEQTGERIYNMARVFNVRSGFRRRDDSLPLRFHQNLNDSRCPENGIPQAAYEQMLSEYYALRGWTNDGVPTPERLEKIGVDEEIMESMEAVWKK